MSKNPTRIQLSLQKALLREMIVRPLEPSERTRFKELLEEHHYLGAPEKLSGEQIKYVATTPDGRWLALLAWAAAAKHLQGREDWIGWNKEQRRRRLSLVTNNARFLILPDARMPNLASRALALCLQRIRGDWQERYGHPVLVAETFVDFQEYEGTCYKASGWELVGNTQGFGRGGMDYYTRHDRPKALFLKELVPGARERLRAKDLPAEAAGVEASSAPDCPASPGQLRGLLRRLEGEFPSSNRHTFPPASVLAVTVMAQLCGWHGGYRDYAAFARRLTQAQRRALGFHVKATRKGKRGVRECSSPGKDVFHHVLCTVDAKRVERALVQAQEVVRGPVPAGEGVAIDGKELAHGGGAQVVTAVTVDTLRFLGGECVAKKSNEIPAVQALIPRLDLEGRLVSLDAMHTQVQTARDLVQECGADYLLTVKDNQRTLRKTVKNHLKDLEVVSPSGGASGEEQGA